MVASTATTLEAMVSHPGFDLYPSGSSARPRAWHLMFVGAQGSGKRTVAAALHRHRFDGPYRPRVTVHTSSALPLGDGSSLPPGDSSRASAPSPARHMDYAVLFLDLTNQAALDDLRQHLALVPPAYFLGRLCILATHYDQRPQHAFGIEDLEAVVDALYDVPIHYINTQNEAECAQFAQKLIRTLTVTTGGGFPVTSALLDAATVNEIVVTSDMDPGIL